MKMVNPKKGGLPRIGLLYTVLGSIIIGLIIVNFAVNLVWLDYFVNETRERSIQYLISEARRVSETVEGSIEVKIQNIKELSQNMAWVQEPEFFIPRFLKENPAIKEISIVNLDGREEKRYSRAEYFTEKDLRDFSFLKEFEDAKQGIIFLSKVDFTEKAEPYLTITTPIRKTEIEKPEAVLRTIFYLKGIWGEVLEVKVGETGRVSIIDDKGMLIADPSPSRVLKKVNLLNLPPTKPLIMGEIFRGDNYFNEKGIEVIGVGVPIKNLRWGVIVEQNIAESEAPIRDIEKLAVIFLASGLILIGISIWLILVLKRADAELIRRHNVLEVQQKELAEAKAVLEVKVRARTKELERVKISLEIEVEARTKELKELAGSLDEQVKERTKELQEKMEELERFNKLAIGRELKMVELKKEIEKLQEELEKYKRSS